MILHGLFGFTVGPPTHTATPALHTMKNQKLARTAAILATVGFAIAGHKFEGDTFYDVTSANPNVDGATVEVPPDDPSTPDVDESETIFIYPPLIGDGPAPAPDTFRWSPLEKVYRGVNHPGKFVDLTDKAGGEGTPDPASYDFERWDNGATKPRYKGQATEF